MIGAVSVLPEDGEGADDGHLVATVLVGGRAMPLAARDLLLFLEEAEVGAVERGLTAAESNCERMRETGDGRRDIAADVLGWCSEVWCRKCSRLRNGVLASLWTMSSRAELCRTKCV